MWRGSIRSSTPAADITISIWKNGSISGTLTDEAGEPVVNAQLRLGKAAFVAGVRRFAPAGPPAFTDDRGAYRFSNLPPGDSSARRLPRRRHARPGARR